MNRTQRKRWAGALELTSRTLILLVGLVAVWEGVSRGLKVPDWMLPAPAEVAHRFVSDWRTWLSDTGVTLLESVLGFAAGSGVGIGVGILFAHSRPLERVLYPYTIALKTIPLVAMAPILAIW